jgi:hypothetical protein
VSHYTEDLKAGGLTQLHPNIDQGGILIFDCNEVITECPEDGESHQLHIRRLLTDEEMHNFETLNGGSRFDMDEDGPGQPMVVDYPGGYWINTGPLNEEARAYFLSLTVDTRWGR